MIATVAMIGLSSRQPRLLVADATSDLGAPRAKRRRWHGFAIVAIAALLSIG